MADVTLALDLATLTGWAALIDGKRMGGTWKLTTEKARKEAQAQNLDRRADPRFSELLAHLVDFELTYGQPKVIWFEDVKFSTYTQQTQLWSSLRAAVWAYQFLCPETDIQCLDTTQLKLWGAQHGGATKSMMGAWLVRKHPDLYVKNPASSETCFVLEKATGAEVDDNQADAQHLLDYALFA
jgi:hypothetical protein